MLNRIKDTINSDRELYTFGFITFFISLAVYIKTMAPTVSFWDCGEFIACSYTLAIPHPPGAPFFILMGRFFSMIPFLENIAISINLVSVVSTAFTILLTYLIIIQLSRGIHGSPSGRHEKYLMYGSAALGAFCFAFTDSLWFNAVEAEVYALSMLFTALVFWLAMKWLEKYNELSSLKYLLFSFYLFGLAFGVHLLNMLVVPTIIMLIVFYRPVLFKKWQFWSIGPLFWLAGATTYFIIYIRSGLDPMINMNNPSTLSGFWYYFSRQQYGSESLFATLFDRVAPFWEYQIKYMYVRYFGWNFIGKGHTIVDMNRGFIGEVVSLNGLKGLPFLLGITGLFYHFRKDWKKALSVLTLFIIAGFGIVIYLNQPDPQPRERDYVFVGSFFAFSLWIGIGIHMLLKTVSGWLSTSSMKNAGIAAAAVVILLAGPANQFNFNYESHDRTGNYVAWTYGHNILAGLEENAIIFTNGDNDTFPLWYMQEVENFRKDVKVVNLSLLNTHWYIRQLVNYEPKMTIGVKDEDIEKLQPMSFKGQDLVLRLPPELITDHFAEYGKQPPQDLLENPAMTVRVEPTIQQGDITGLRLQDQIILQIVMNNLGQKPIYFAITVDPNYYVGLNHFFRLEGMVYRVTPVKNPEINTEILRRNTLETYSYKGINDPDVYLNFSSTRLVNNFRNGFMRLAQHYASQRDSTALAETLDSLTTLLPESRSNFNDYLLLENIGRLYFFAGKPEEYHKRIVEMLEWEPAISVDRRLNLGRVLVANFNDYERAEKVFREIYESDKENNRNLAYLLGVYENTSDWKNAVEAIEDWLLRHPDDLQGKAKLQEYRDSLANAGKLQDN